MNSQTRITVNGETHEVTVTELERERVVFELNGRTYRVEFERAVPATTAADKRATPRGGRAVEGRSGGGVVAPMPGVVVGITCAAGDSVQAGQTLLTIEAMKMQNTVTAPTAGTVEQVLVVVGEEVRDGQPLVIVRSPS